MELGVTPSGVQILVTLDRITHTNELLNMFRCPSYRQAFIVSIGYRHNFLAMPPEFLWAAAHPHVFFAISHASDH
jgi:hypothetical protein